MKRIFAAILCTSLTSCAVTVFPMPTGGSKADGTIEFTYTHRQTEIPSFDEDKVTQEAVERCRAWDFSGAEAFGGSTSIIQNGQYYVTFSYQCTGN